MAEYHNVNLAIKVLKHLVNTIGDEVWIHKVYLVRINPLIK